MAVLAVMYNVVWSELCGTEEQKWAHNKGSCLRRHTPCRVAGRMMRRNAQVMQEDRQSK